MTGSQKTSIDKFKVIQVLFVMSTHLAKCLGEVNEAGDLLSGE